jgi:hypothetical protein
MGKFADACAALNLGLPSARVAELLAAASSELEDRLRDAGTLGLNVGAPMRLHCPLCDMLHVDEGQFAVRPHHTHACQGCGHVWRPAVMATVGVRYLPGFKNAG